jgi:thiol-disulfide isomerase/thioredoxin
MRQSSLNRFARAAALFAVFAITSLAGASAQMAPDFSLPTRSGEAVSLARLRGQVVMINFWASWCGPCRQEMPLLEQMYQKYNRLGFTLVGVNVDENSADAERLLTKVPVSFPVALDSKSEVSKLYKVQAMPSSIFVDRKGTVRYWHPGYKPGDEAKYQEQIRALLKE